MPSIYRTSVNSVNRISGLSECNDSHMDDSNERLRKLREAAGFASARAAALRFHWTVSTYASHENGQTPVPRKAAEKYAKAFKSSAAYILTGDGPVNHIAKKDTHAHKPDIRRIGRQPDLMLDTPISVPEIDVRAGASYAGGFNQEEATLDEFGNSISQDAVRANWGIPPLSERRAPYPSRQRLTFCQFVGTR